MLRHDHYDQLAQMAAQDAVALLSRYGHHLINIEHILLALLEQESEEVLRLLGQRKKNVKSMEERVDQFLCLAPLNEHLYYTSDHIFISTQVATMMERAHLEAVRAHDALVSPRHIFLAILQMEDAPGFRILSDEGITYTQALENSQESPFEPPEPADETGTFPTTSF